MADKAKRKSVTAVAPDDPWRSGRARFSLHQIRRGRDHKWVFPGQQPGEQVRMVLRKHWWYLVKPALPVLGSVILLFAIAWAAIVLPQLGVFWLLLEVGSFLLLLGTGAWFAYSDLVKWWYETYIITNTRIINSRGLLEPSRQQTPIEKIQQLGLDIQRTGLLLGYGTIHVYLTGGDFYIRDVANPRRVRDTLLGITEEHKARKPKDVPVPVPKDTAMAAVLEALAKEKAVPKLPDADADLPASRNSERVRGPRRTFGGFLRIPCNVRYVSGEYTVKYVQRSQYVLLRNLLPSLLGLLVLFPLTVLAPTLGIVAGPLLQYWWFLMGLGILALLCWAAITYANYVDDVYILSNRRVIDIERKIIFFGEKHQEAEYKNVRDVKVKVSSVLERLLDVGDVYIETPGSSPDIVLSKVDHPFVLQDEISGIRAHKEKVDKANQANKEKEALHLWFGTVVTKLEETAQSRGTPNLKELDLISAVALAHEHGLDVAVRGEAMDAPGFAPGHVVLQSPPPGTLMAKDSKIEIVLSKRPLLVE